MKKYLFDPYTKEKQFIEIARVNISKNIPREEWQIEVINRHGRIIKTYWFKSVTDIQKYLKRRIKNVIDEKRCLDEL